MWKNEVLVWEDTTHKWNEFGTVTTVEDYENNDLYAKGIIIWKKSTLWDFVTKIVATFEVGNEFIEDKTILTGFALSIATVSLFPFKIKIIKDDEIANKFLSLIKREKAQYFILKKDFENSEFGEIESLKLLINDFVENDILLDVTDRYIINGKVLNGSHLLEDKK